MGSKRLDTVADLVRHGLNAQVECRRCHRVVIIPASRLRDQCFAKSIPMKLAVVAQHLRDPQRFLEEAIRLDRYGT